MNFSKVAHAIIKLFPLLQPPWCWFAYISSALCRYWSDRAARAHVSIIIAHNAHDEKQTSPKMSSKAELLYIRRSKLKVGETCQNWLQQGNGTRRCVFIIFIEIVGNVQTTSDKNNYIILLIYWYFCISLIVHHIAIVLIYERRMQLN